MFVLVLFELVVVIKELVIVSLVAVFILFAAEKAPRVVKAKLANVDITELVDDADLLDVKVLVVLEVRQDALNNYFFK